MAQIDHFFQKVKENGASDLHMAIGFPPLLRLRGDLFPLDAPVLTPESNQTILSEILSNEQFRELEHHKEFDKAYELAGVGRFRCNFFYQHRGIGAVFRLIPTDILTLEQLGMPEIIGEIASYERGLILVTGPTGSGKSTTMAAIIDRINNSYAKHIITIEDPLEFVHPNKKSIFSQREIGTHAQSFAQALKVASREDPDVILVGEMRDLETISLALTCAELGILVFGTLHTNSAGKTIDRIINAFPSDQQAQTRTMLSESLKAVIAQQLLKTSDGRGRCAAVEILLGSPALATIIRESKISQIDSFIQSGKTQGMQTMDHHLRELLNGGRITLEAAREKAIDKNLFVSDLEN